MVKYNLTCTACGDAFTAARRHAQTCSSRCYKRTRRGGISDKTVRDASAPDFGESGHALPSSGGACAAANRTYAIYRGPAAAAEMVTIDRLGRITSGAFSGLRISELIRTAHKQGWLTYRRRDDGWYAAEWWPERKCIALCGPCELPRVSAPALGDDYARAA